MYDVYMSYMHNNFLSFRCRIYPFLTFKYSVLMYRVLLSQNERQEVGPGGLQRADGAAPRSLSGTLIWVDAARSDGEAQTMTR